MAPRTRLFQIMVVENHDDTRTYLCRYLEEKGHSVKGVSDLASALALFPHHPFDILLSDIGLPDGDGWDLLKRIAEAHPLPYSIAMSGYGSPRDIQTSTAAGYRHHLTKPFVPQDIDAILEKASEAIPLN